ncbi:SGNH/GDSL hydrolase family protein [Rhizobium calliandrae]|uniref:SGNH/GDSL hydrolase family protein n=1 Tax=Rhizobium calliandrae TaxID=1312182 RepID=A0ABT7KIP9_9HYPH|nr:SGNH/GDSL hydrolase family protein [Rhizobium calliandrae]MDL2408504.1 SGNH/GDSL hydrolase family protein [Rhizobium calliandrae]
MQEDLFINQRHRKAINDELDDREKEHQKIVAQHEALFEATRTLTGKAAIKPKYLLAIGDSWYDYPIQGNSLVFIPSDILAQLKQICDPAPIILSSAHRGDASTIEMSLPKQEKIIQFLTHKQNWPNGKPDAIIVSAGGNDVAGNSFCIFLDFNDGRHTGLNQARYAGVLNLVRACYLDLFAVRDRYASGVPIYAHCYDFPTPSGIGAPCGIGPWLWPSLQFCNWSKSTGKQIAHDALAKFKDMLDDLASVPANNFHVVPTQGTLNDQHWANELHPDPTGFRMIARKVADSLGIDHDQGSALAAKATIPQSPAGPTASVKTAKASGK